jgi:hypothetical protein
MKIKSALPFAATFVLLSGSAALAQATGVSHPEALDDEMVTAPPAASTDHYVKPSPAVPMQQAAPARVEAVPSRDGDVLVMPQPVVRMPRPIDPNDDNSGVVINVPVGPNELPVGAHLMTRLDTEVSTRTTAAGTPFRAVLTVDTYSHGQVVLPQGSVITGRITQIHGGRRVSGPSVIQMVPDTMQLPDGSVYRLRAQVSSIDHYNDSKVNSEGTIVSNSHGKTTAAILGGTTATGAIAGAMIGGGVGAAVGAGIAGGAGLVFWLKQDRQQVLPKGLDITFSLDAPFRLNVPAYSAQAMAGSTGR